MLYRVSVMAAMVGVAQAVNKKTADVGMAYHNVVVDGATNHATSHDDAVKMASAGTEAASAVVSNATVTAESLGVSDDTPTVKGSSGSGKTGLYPNKPKYSLADSYSDTSSTKTNGVIEYGYNCTSENDVSNDDNCYNATAALPYGECGFTRNGTEFLSNTTCGGSPLNNLWSNCSLVILPDYNDQNLIVNPFWCFDPTICGQVMQQGFMTGKDDTTDNKRCCSSISAACAAGWKDVWKDYHCKSKYSNQQKCQNIGDDTWTGYDEEDQLTEEQKINKLCQASMEYVNDCCCSTSSCFAGDSLVTKSDGTDITLNELKKGDMVRSPAGVEEIIGFIHDSDHNARTFLDISHEHGGFNVSSGHLIFLATGESVMAAELKVGSQIATAAGSSAVTSVGYAEVDTFKAPLTASGTLTVGGVHASSYADVESHAMAHWALSPVRMAQQMFSTSVTETPATVAPVCPNVVS